MDEQLFLKGFHGKGVHVDTSTVFDGLDWQKAGEKPENCPHSVWETLFHMNYWQDFMLSYLKGKTPKSPEHASESWPDSPAPASEEEWQSAIVHFLDGLKEGEHEAAKDLLEQGFGGPERTRADCLLSIMLHNTYHAGQAVFARRTIGAWPPPSGGDTW
ncbi:DinB family protein [Planococcus sp. YIM B11945]|uniref:DinB family protein n=1 Tax=Planococcus sp. YIM B11945 TaxID=3435410 RepID=UPI003D7D8CBF